MTAYLGALIIVLAAAGASGGLPAEVVGGVVIAFIGLAGAVVTATLSYRASTRANATSKDAAAAADKAADDVVEVEQRKVDREAFEFVVEEYKELLAEARSATTEARAETAAAREETTQARAETTEARAEFRRVALIAEQCQRRCSQLVQAFRDHEIKLPDLEHVDALDDTDLNKPEEANP